MKWYEFKPSDTLFFRGAEPMEGGMDYETTLIFLPSVSVISGAIRTSVLAQKSISISEYRNEHSISGQIGEYGKDAPFDVTGPFIKYRSDYFVPAPYTWFTADSKNSRKIRMVRPVPLESDVKNRLGLKSSPKLISWVKHDNEVKSIGGNWISLNGLVSKNKKFENGKSIFMSGNTDTSLFSVEKRTGISIDHQRKVEESKLYNARHIRLKSDVSLLWGIDRDCGLSASGILVLGGEQRFGRYKELDQAPVFPDSGSEYLALSPVAVSEESKNKLIAAGQISYRGGWNLAKQFHKDMTGFYPAGSVFNENINNCCIPF